MAQAAGLGVGSVTSRSVPIKGRELPGCFPTGASWGMGVGRHSRRGLLCATGPSGRSCLSVRCREGPGWPCPAGYACGRDSVFPEGKSSSGGAPGVCRGDCSLPRTGSPCWPQVWACACLSCLGCACLAPRNGLFPGRWAGTAAHSSARRCPKSPRAPGPLHPGRRVWGHHHPIWGSLTGMARPVGGWPPLISVSTVPSEGSRASEGRATHWM